MTPLFTDPKLNAMREAAIRGDWGSMFAIAPRGCVGSAGPTLADGTRGVCADAPEIPIGDPRGQAMYDYWHGKNPLRKNLTIQDLRKTVNGAGQVVSVPLTEPEIRDFFENYQWARHDWKCTQGQIEEYIHDAVNGRLIYPLAQCAQSSASRRRKAVKKAAAIGAVVTGAVFLGPSIIKGVGSILPGGAPAAAGAVPGASGIATAGAGAGSALAPSLASVGVSAGQTGFLAKVTAGAGSMLEWVNRGRTVDAIVNGEMPPPPIDISGAAFRDYAFEAAQNELAEQMQRRLTRDEENQLRAEIFAMQAELQRITPTNARMTPNANVPAVVQGEMAATRNESENINSLMTVAIPVALGLLLFRGA